MIGSDPPGRHVWDRRGRRGRGGTYFGSRSRSKTLVVKVGVHAAISLSFELPRLQGEILFVLETSEIDSELPSCWDHKRGNIQNESLVDQYF